MLFSNTPPIVGYDLSGNPVNMIVAFDGSAVTASNLMTINAPTSTTATWQKISVDAMYQSATGIVAMGYGFDQYGQRYDLTYTNVSGEWIIGKSPVAGIKSHGICENGSNFLVASVSNRMIFETDFAYTLPTPAGGLSNVPPTTTLVNADFIYADGIDYNGTTHTAYSVYTAGSYTPYPTATIMEYGDWWLNTEYPHVVPGGTALTPLFPGYTDPNAQLQYIDAVAPADTPPVDWGYDRYWYNIENYYGITNTGSYGTPSITVTWTTIG